MEDNNIDDRGYKENRCKANKSRTDGEEPIFMCTARHARQCEFGIPVDIKSDGCRYWEDSHCSNIKAQMDIAMASVIVFRRWLKKHCKGSEL